MSAERWGPLSDTRSRLQACGHSCRHCDVKAEDDLQNVKCPVCGQDAGDLRAVAVTRDFVPEADMSWGGAERTFSRRFKPPKEGVVRTIQNLTAEMSRRGVHVVDLHNVNAGHASIDQVSEQMVVLRATTSGCSVRAGTVSFPDDGPLLLNGCGAHFTDVCFSGGAVVCAGARYSGTFHDCRFQCAVYVVHGADAAFTGCTFTACIGVVASGSATVATLEGCMFRGCLTSVIAEAGAAVRAASTTMWDTDTAVIANDCDTRVSLDRCELHGAGPAGVGRRGVVAVCGASARLRDCRLSHMVYALEAVDAPARIEVDRVHLVGVGGGALVEAGARLTMRDTDVALFPTFARACIISNDSGDDSGDDGLKALTVGAGTRQPGGAAAQLERCRIRGSKSSGITLGARCALTATLCDLDVHSVPVLVDDGSTACRVLLRRCTARSAATVCSVNAAGSVMRLEGCVLEGWRLAAHAGAGAKLVAVGCTVRAFKKDASSRAVAVHIEGDAAAQLLRCELLSEAKVMRCNGTATVKQCSAAVAMRRSVRLSPWDFGEVTLLYECDVGELRIQGGSMRGADLGVALALGARADMAGVDVTECHAGVRTEDTAVASVTGCTFRGPLQGAAMAAADERTSSMHALRLEGAGGTVEGCTITGYFVGVAAAAAARVDVRRCKISDVPEGGACVMCTSAVVVDGCEFQSAHRCVVAESAGASVEVRASVFGPNVHHGVSVAEAANATVKDSRFRECTVAMFAGARAILAVHDCRCVGSDFGILAESGRFAVAAERLTVSGGRTGVKATAGPGVPASVDVVDSTIADAQIGVTFEGRGLSGRLSRLQVEGCTYGVCIGGAASASMHKVRVKGGEEGVMVGDVDFLLGEKCDVCGREGYAAGRMAWAAVDGVLDLGDPERRPRCVHEGARAIVTMSDCEVRGCDLRGVRINTHGHLTARRVHAAECGTGFSEAVLGARSVFTGCTAVPHGGTHPAVALLQGSAHADTAAGPVPIPEIKIVGVQ